MYVANSTVRHILIIFEIKPFTFFKVVSRKNGNLLFKKNINKGHNLKQSISRNF